MNFEKFNSKKVLCAFLLFSVLSLSIAQSNTPCEILSKTIEKYQSNINAFQLDYLRTTDGEDTLKYSGNLFYNNSVANKPPYYILESGNNNYIYFNNPNYYGLNNIQTKEFADLSKTDSTHLLKGKMVRYLIPEFLICHSFLKEFMDCCKSKKIKFTENNESYILSIPDSTINNMMMKGQLIGQVRFSLTSICIDKKTYMIVKHYSQIRSVINGVESNQEETIKLNKIKMQNEDIVARIKNVKPFTHSSKLANELAAQAEITDKVFPNFVLKDLNNLDFSDNNISSRYVLVEFFYKACAPCIVNMKQLNKLDSLYSEKDLTILAVDDIDTDCVVLNTFIKKFKPNFEVLFQGKSLSSKLHINGHPQTFIYDNKDKKIVFTETGGRYTYAEDMKLVLDKIINHNKTKSYTAVLITCISVILGLVLFVLTRSHTRSATRQR